MSGRIAAVPQDLAAESRRLKDAAAEVQSMSTTLRAPLPPMPGAVRGHVEGELDWALVALSQLGGALLDEAGAVGNRGRLFEFAGTGAFSIALGGYLGTLEQVANPWVDGLERVLVASRYVRFGTWVRAYSYVNRYGTVVNVGKHWRNLPSKLMDEKPVFAGLGEDSTLVKSVRVAATGGLVLTFVTSGFDEWEQDAGVGTARRAVDSVAVGATTTGGAWAGAEGGAIAGATIGSFVGPEGTVVGGAVGALVGGVGGSWLGHAVGHAIAHLL